MANKNVVILSTMKAEKEQVSIGSYGNEDTLQISLSGFCALGLETPPTINRTKSYKDLYAAIIMNNYKEALNIVSTYSAKPEVHDMRDELLKTC